MITVIGSGIIIYGALFSAYATNSTFSIDGQLDPTPLTIPPLSGPEHYNVTLYGLQSLPLVYHIFTVSLVNWENRASGFFFDYAYINETAPALSSLTTPSPSSSSTPSAAVFPHSQ